MPNYNYTHIFYAGVDLHTRSMFVCKFSMLGCSQQPGGPAPDFLQFPPSPTHLALDPLPETD